MTPPLYSSCLCAPLICCVTRCRRVSPAFRRQPPLPRLTPPPRPRPPLLPSSPLVLLPPPLPPSPLPSPFVAAPIPLPPPPPPPPFPPSLPPPFPLPPSSPPLPLPLRLWIQPLPHSRLLLLLLSPPSPPLSSPSSPTLPPTNPLLPSLALTVRPSVRAVGAPAWHVRPGWPPHIGGPSARISTRLAPAGRLQRRRLSARHRRTRDGTCARVPGHGWTRPALQHLLDAFDRQWRPVLLPQPRVRPISPGMLAAQPQVSVEPLGGSGAERNGWGRQPLPTTKATRARRSTSSVVRLASSDNRIPVSANSRMFAVSRRDTRSRFRRSWAQQGSNL